MGFDFAFGVGSDIPSNVGGFTVKQIEFVFEEQANGKSVRKKLPNKDLELTKCGTEFFRFDDKKEIEDLQIDQMNCLKDTDYELKGNYYAQNYKYLELKLWRCSS